ncbi:dihydrolipoamide dehydrogenase [Christiangramia fulva]|uniref:Dihydrolipoamide dehydrogenase n=1 Tax=Christiangramia fulva TaxID=2126553 RepID=A0A2R3Z791_9FLAO|nr:DUF2911 domain-containing protein [Christiangramia fulva]AVR46147.1 dihydrolipoamide dehydrogenase [Christiangramia fulva]
MKELQLLFLVLTTAVMSAQVEAPQPSPQGKIQQKVGLTDVAIEYSRPGMKGRTIFGDLVPYGELWRTGANANTTISFSDDVTIEGNTLKAGKYAIYTVPREKNWQVIFYKNTDNWGVPQEWDESKVALKATAEVDELPFDVETFTIFLNNLTNDSGVLEFVWANKIASLPFQVPTEKKAMASIDRIMNGPTANDYFSAAAYYHDAGKDLNKAYEWIKKAAEMAGEDAYWVFRKKSLIEADLGKKQEAIASAKRSLASAKKNGNPDYVKLNEDSLKEWGAMK